MTTNAAATPATIESVMRTAATNVSATASAIRKDVSASSDNAPGQTICASADNAMVSGMPGSTKSLPGHAPARICCAHATCMK